MPLIETHRTNLKSLRYGSDRPGGANSGQPFIKSPIPQNRLNRTSRAGLLFHSQDIDPERLKKYLDTPKGIIFTANQQVLSRIGVRTQTERTPNEGVYIRTTSLAQAKLSGFQTGATIRNFPRPFATTGARDSLEEPLTYSGTVKFNQPSSENRLVKLVSEHLYEGGNPVQEFASSLKKTSDSIFNVVTGVGNLLGVNTAGLGTIQSTINRVISPFASPVLLKYPGGPGSELGIGETSIFFADKRILRKQDTQNLVTETPERNDIKRYTPAPEPVEPLKQKSVSRVNYTRSPGKQKDGDRKNPFLFEADKLKPLDAINALSVYRGTGPTSTQNTNDLVKFRFAVIDNDTPNEKDYIHFRAFLNGFRDDYSAGWNGFRYPGRGEQFYKYGGFDRQFSIDWVVYAQSKAELIPMYQKLNFLASSITPDYSDAGFMRGNLIQLTVGGYLYEQPGFINTLTYTAPEDSPYEISVLDTTTSTGLGGAVDSFIEGINSVVGDEEGLADSATKELPYRINASVNFTPIHTFRPQKQSSQLDSSRYIALSNGANNNYDNQPQLRRGGGELMQTPKTSIPGISSPVLTDRSTPQTSIVRRVSTTGGDAGINDSFEDLENK